MKKIEGEVTWQTINPPVEGIIMKGLLLEDAHIQSWGWVDCEALGKCIQEHFLRSKIVWPEDGVLRIGSVFDHYGHLDVNAEGEPVYTWANASGVTIKGKPPFASEWSVPFKVPRRVSTGILSLVHQGIVRVTVERVPVPAPNYYFHIGHGANGTKFEILNGGRGDGSYRVVTWRPPLKGGLAPAPKPQD